MIEQYSNEEILIVIKTYPEYSAKHTETVCSGGILKRTKKLIRLYPIRFRYLDGESQFKKYQWIKAKIRKAPLDGRPESYNIIEESIKLGETIIPPDGWAEREKWLINSQNVYSSVEQIYEKQSQVGTSLGLVKPKKIINFSIRKKAPDEITQAELRKKKIMEQLGIFEDKKDLELLPIRFVLSFSCNNINCQGHEMSILDWEIGQLYRRLKRNNDTHWESKIRTKVIDDLCGPKKSTYLILGNMAKRRHIFCICGFFNPPLYQQRMLF